MSNVVVRFLVSTNGYTANECAGFAPDVAAKLVDQLYARYLGTPAEELEYARKSTEASGYEESKSQKEVLDKKAKAIDKAEKVKAKQDEEDGIVPELKPEDVIPGLIPRATNPTFNENEMSTLAGDTTPKGLPSSNNPMSNIGLITEIDDKGVVAKGSAKAPANVEVPPPPPPEGVVTTAPVVVAQKRKHLTAGKGKGYHTK